MSRTVKVNGNEYHVKSNYQPRPLYAIDELPIGIAEEWFAYAIPADLENDAIDFSARFFEYRGSWYDVNEFESVVNDFKVMGWDGVQTESHFSAVVVQWFNVDGEYRYDEIVVGYVHW